MWKNRKIKYFLSILSLFSLIYLMSCDIYKSKETQISGIDKVVCEQFSDSVFQEISSVPMDQYYPEKTNAQLGEVVSGLTDSLMSDSLFIEQNSPNAYELTLGKGNDTTYLAVKLNKDGMVWFSTGVVDVNVFQQDGAKVKLSNDTMPLETISGCTESNDSGLQEPVIKMRLTYDNVKADNLLLQIIKVEQTKSLTFKVSVQ